MIFNSYFTWELKENSFENISSMNRNLINKDGCDIRIENLSHEDILTFRLREDLS